MELTEIFHGDRAASGERVFSPELVGRTRRIFLNEYLPEGRTASVYRAIGAGRDARANYGIYGPAFELGENVPVREGSEEYLDSEKYQVRVWNRKDPEKFAGPDKAGEQHSPRSSGFAAQRRF